MKLSNGELHSDGWDDSYKYAKEKQNIIETLQWYDKQLAKPQRWNFTCINTIKTFITLKNNNYRVEGSLYSKGWAKGWDHVVIDKRALVIPDNVKNSTCVINNNPSWRYIGTRGSNHASDSNDNVSVSWQNRRKMINPNFGLLRKVWIISIIFLLLSSFNIERTNLPSIDKDETTLTDDSGYCRTGTRAENGTGEGNFTTIRSHIRTFINGKGLSEEFLAQNYDLYAWGNIDAKYLNPGAINLYREGFGMAEGDRKFQALQNYCDLYGLTINDMEDMFLHAKEDVNYTLGQPNELDPKVTKLVPGWDQVNDLNSDYYINDTEFDNRANLNASARYKNESRIPIYYWGPPTDHQMNIGHPDYQDFLVNYYFNQLAYNNEEYDDPVFWKTTNPIEVVDEHFSGFHSILMEVEGEDKNLNNKQDVKLEPNMTYTIGVMIKTENITGGLKVYEYEDPNQFSGLIHVNSPTSNWAFYYSQFRTDGYVNNSRIVIKFYGGPGKIWVDDIHLAEGEYDNYDDLISQPNILKNGGFEDIQTGRYDGFWLDTLHTYLTLQGDTIVLEYPNLDQYSVDIKTLLSDLKNSLPNDTIIIGNGWISDPLIISGSEYENWARITTSIDSVKLNTIIDWDEKGIMQLIQYIPIYHEITNPNRPDLFIEGVTLDRDQLYSLALYYLVQGNYTYYGYGVHGGYHLDEERWFEAVNYDIGQPLGSYYFFDGVDNETENILINGDFETDNDADGNPDYWQPAEPVELDSDIKYKGNFSVKIDSETEINNINRQYVTLEPNTTYTLSGWIKTENVTGEYGGANIYPYGFDDLQESDSWIGADGTTDWTFYSMIFTTGSDTEGKINYRIFYGAGTAWFDDIRLTKGRSNKVFARDFQNATVLLKTSFNVGDNTTTAYDLDGNYHPLKADGTIDTFVNKIELMGGEGAILIREDLSITTPEILPGGLENIYYSYNFTAIGGKEPVQWSLISDSLPQGLTLDIDGTISGSPNKSGEYSFIVEISDAWTRTESKEFTLSIGIRDLMIDNIVMPKNPVFIDEEVNINVTVYKIGNLPLSESISVQLHIDNTVISSESIIMNNETEKNISFLWTAEEGLHNITINVDAENIVIESNESNNIVDKEFYIYQLPDIWISEIDISSDLIFETDRIYINSTLSSYSELPLNENITAELLIDNQILYTRDLVFGDNQFMNVSFVWDAVSGLHEIEILVDSSDILKEAHEDNNNKTTQIRVYIPLTVVSIVMSDPSPTKAGTVSYTITFSEDMDTTVSPIVTFGLTSPYDMHEITESSYVGDTWTGSFDIDSTTGDGTYTIKVSGAEDLAGIQMATDTSYTFLIDTKLPEVASATPIGTDIPITTNISITFNETMNHTSVQNAFCITDKYTTRCTWCVIDGSFNWSGNTMTFTPDTNLNYGTEYTIIIGTSAKDLAENGLALPYNWSFTTIQASEITLPTVDYIIIRDESDGKGNVVEDVTFTLGKEVTSIYYCAAYNYTAGYIGERIAEWTVTNGIGNLSHATGTISNFTALTTGTGVISANLFGIINSTGVITVYSAIDMTTILAPTDVIVRAISSSEIKIEWVLNSETNVVNYIIQRSTGPNGPWDSIAIVDKDSEYYIDTNLKSNSIYYYRVIAVDNEANESPPSQAPCARTHKLEEFSWTWVLIIFVILVVLILVISLIKMRKPKEVSLQLIELKKELPPPPPGWMSEKKGFPSIVDTSKDLPPPPPGWISREEVTILGEEEEPPPPEDEILEDELPPPPEFDIPEDELPPPDDEDIPSLEDDEFIEDDLPPPPDD